jgi:uncharacterized protein
MIIKSEFTIDINTSDFISGDIYRANNIPELKPIILIIHGFKVHKQWGFFPYICDYFAQYGAIAICCNLSLNGYGTEGDILIHPQKFASNTITRELSDIQKIMEFIQKKGEEKLEDWDGRIFILGHSRGGALSILTARDFPIISKIAVWNSIARFDRFTARQKVLWREQGYLAAEHYTSTDSLCINSTYLEDLELYKDRFSVISALSNIDIGLIIIHGEQDITVSKREAETLASASTHLMGFNLIPSTGHTFGIRHPFTSSTKALEQVLEITKGFFLS